MKVLINSRVSISNSGILLMPAILIGIATFLYWISLQLFVPLLPGYARDLGASTTMIGIISGTYGFMQLLLRIPTGIWADRLGLYKPFVLVGCVLAFVSGLALLVSGNPLGLVVGRTLAGLAATVWLR